MLSSKLKRYYTLDFPLLKEVVSIIKVTLKEIELIIIVYISYILRYSR